MEVCFLPPSPVVVAGLKASSLPPPTASSFPLFHILSFSSLEFSCSLVPRYPKIDIMSLTVDLKTPASGAYKQPIGL